MEHVTEEDLVLLYYSEPGVEATRAHLVDCADCRTEYQALQRLLNTMDAGAVPERDADYGRRLWEKVSARARVRRYTWRALGAIAAGLIIGFSLQFGGKPAAPVPAQAQTQVQPQDDVSERVLAAALESHLESSRLVLTEIVNQQGPGQMWSRETAEDLLADNRLYRQTAEATGQAETERLLENLEEVLVEVAHAQESSPELRRRIESKGVLFAIKARTAQEGIL